MSSVRLNYIKKRVFYCEYKKSLFVLLSQTDAIALLVNTFLKKKSKSAFYFSMCVYFTACTALTRKYSQHCMLFNFRTLLYSLSYSIVFEYFSLHYKTE